MEDLPVTFSWVYPKFKTDGECTVYCFAYIRDPKNYHVLYAGVKYKGLFSDLKAFKSSLRRTALERLKRKPIFSIFSLGDDEKYKENLSNPKYRFNGFGNFNKEPKKTVALGKFFLHCALNQTYGNLGIKCNKLSADLKFHYNTELDKYETGKAVSDIDTIYLKYGYEYRGDEVKRIVSGNLLNWVFNLRSRAKFYGKGGDRRKFEDYYKLDAVYLETFGVGQKKKKNENNFRLRGFITDKRVIYYRYQMSANTQAHITLMEIHDWMDYVSEVYGKDVKFDIPGLLFNTYCVGFTIQRNYRTKSEKNIYRTIATGRLIDRPTILDSMLFEGKQVKEVREWFADRLGYLSENGIGRINWKKPVKLMSYYVELMRYNEMVRFYMIDNTRYTWGDFVGELLNPVRNFFRL